MNAQGRHTPQSITEVLDGLSDEFPSGDYQGLHFSEVFKMIVNGEINNMPQAKQIQNDLNYVHGQITQLEESGSPFDKRLFDARENHFQKVWDLSEAIVTGTLSDTSAIDEAIGMRETASNAGDLTFQDDGRLEIVERTR